MLKNIWGKCTTEAKVGKKIKGREASHLIQENHPWKASQKDKETHISKATMIDKNLINLVLQEKPKSRVAAGCLNAFEREA